MIRIGIEQLCDDPPEWLQEKRLALLSNQASTDRCFRHTRDLLELLYPGRLTCLFSPQHGFFSEKQDNMVESDHLHDHKLEVPVFSLYSENRKPSIRQFAYFDVLLIDLIDVGTRVYTFAWTVVYCLQRAAETGKKVIILDRPNPLGGSLIEGNILKKEWASFVGLLEIPMRHGLTLGELALLCNQEMNINADLDVVKIKGWQREMSFAETGFPWVFPSPNMPGAATALVYPGQVIWEGTNVSEGRGTTLPFEIFGAPFIEHKDLDAAIDRVKLPGCLLRPLVFEPCFGKWAGQSCQGFQIHVTDLDSFRPYRTSLLLLQFMLSRYPDSFVYKDPPYEYEFERLPLDLILGDQQVRLALEEGVDVLALEQGWTEELDEFESRRRAVFLYA